MAMKPTTTTTAAKTPKGNPFATKAATIKAPATKSPKPLKINSPVTGKSTGKAY